MVNGKPQIFYDAIGLCLSIDWIFSVNSLLKINVDDSSTKAKSTKNSPTINTRTQQFDQRNKGDNQKYVEPKRQPTKTEQPTNKKRVNEDDSLGVYMTMDEIADLVTAVKENSKSRSTFDKNFI